MAALALAALFFFVCFSDQMRLAAPDVRVVKVERIKKKTSADTPQTKNFMAHCWSQQFATEFDFVVNSYGARHA